MNRSHKVTISAKGRRPKNRHTQSKFDFVRLRQPRIEVKQINVSARNVAYYDAAAGQIMIDVTAIAQGNTGATRVGDMAVLQQLSFQYWIYNSSGATANLTTITRIVFFQYMADSSVAGKPTLADMFNVSNANVGATYGAFSAFDIDYARTYRVLSDKKVETFGCAVAPTAIVYGISQMGRYSVPLSRAQRELNFQAGATTGNNHIFMLVTSDQQTTALNPLISYNLDVRFVDS